MPEALLELTTDLNLTQVIAKPTRPSHKQMVHETIYLFTGIAPLRRQGNIVTDCKANTEILVEQFYSVFTKDYGGHIPRTNKRIPGDMPSISIGKKHQYTAE
ncbi:hypothetical protein MAR_000406 [Mya arenaria]|uniref:Uncharacterized protein n=1 Tax=Mya arenaria TaxID=6604 RepID=A0ABY7F8Q5_MYAAR|nr:hypothetical protein MAR_000406 [Mya arenaria]